MSMKHFSAVEIKALPKRVRASFVNSLSGFKSVNLVGTVSDDGVTNLSVVSSVVHLGADPALMGFIMRPVTVTRDTYNNIMTNGQYTFNHIAPEFFKKAHQAAARYPELVSEFEAVGLTPEFLEGFKAPFVKESHLKIALNFREKMEIRLNGTYLFIGEIVAVQFPENCMKADGYLDIEQAGSVTCSGLDAYHTTQRLARLSYAKADRPLTELED